MFEPIEIKDSGVHINGHGTITSAEILQTNEEVIRLIRENHCTYQLWHFYDIEDFMLSAKEMRILADQDTAASKNFPLMKVAIVASSPLVFGLSRMYEAFCAESTWETDIFHDLDEAKQWINA